MKQFKRIAETGFILALLALLVFAWWPGRPQAGRGGNVQELSGTVLSVDNSEILQAGAGAVGIQRAVVVIHSGPFKGLQVEAVNHLNGQLEMDEIYVPGDRILTAIHVKEGEIIDARAVNTFRQGWEFALFVLFALALVAYSGGIGIKALVSFLAALGVLWWFYIPSLLKGAAPLPLSLAVLVLLSMVIVFSVAGLTRHAVAAFLGTVCGLGITLVFTLFFGDKLNLGGMTQPFAATMLVQGGYGLNFRHIFYAAVMLGASGAAMDIAMDVSVSMKEIKVKRPDMTLGELIRSGFTVGRAVIGTMATTLLLAYSGGCLTMLMVFVSQGTSFTRILNMKLVAAEIFRVLIGSMGLLMVAPVTACIAGVLLCGINGVEFKKIFTKNKKIVKSAGQIDPPE
ncbi:MAG: YibE/F family protein [Desulfobacter sp.]|nr:MAG: YibE/F family protein [Desulfobacter sp.]